MSRYLSLLAAAVLVVFSAGSVSAQFRGNDCELRAKEDGVPVSDYCRAPSVVRVNDCELRAKEDGVAVALYCGPKR